MPMPRIVGEGKNTNGHEKKYLESLVRTFQLLLSVNIYGCYAAILYLSLQVRWKGGVCHIGVTTFVASTLIVRSEHSLLRIYAADNMLILACCIIGILYVFENWLQNYSFF